MKLLDMEFSQAKNLLLAAKRIVIISHRMPDGDTVGANLALRLALKYQWNKDIISACIDSPPRDSDFLPDVGAYVNDFDQSRADLIIVVDAGARHMTKFHEIKPTLFAGKPPVINVDHHASNDNFGTINIVDPQAASTTQILYHFLLYCGFKMNRKIATCLLHGLYFDTGSFMHSNTTPEVLCVASDLLWKGADFKTIVRKQFHTMTISQLKIYGQVLERARVNSKKITVSAISNKDFIAYKATPGDAAGAIDYLNSIPDGDVCCLIHEDRRGFLKGSLRTRVEGVDLSRIAGMFGGGGHKKASGFSLPGRLIQIGDKITIGENDGK